jgi:hypothetical protein
MNTKRRADLQRKLSHTAVPRPPAGLADRIKADIPKYLQAETDRGRFSRAVAFNMRVAASILFLVTSLVVTVYLVDAPPREKASMATPGPFAPAARSLPQPAPSASAPEEVRFDDAGDRALEVPQIAMATPPPAAPQRRVQASGAASARPRTESGSAVESEEVVAGGVVGSVAGGVVGGTAGGVVSNAEPQAMVAQDQAAPQPVAPPMVAEAAPARAERSASLGLVPEARAAKTSLEPKDEVFGISIDPQSFQRIRRTLESGGRPAASAVNVEAIINYFAGPPARRPRRGVRLDVEVSPAAIEAEGDHAILRFSVDTPAANPAAGSAPPVAKDVRVDVVFNKDVVAKATRVGGSEAPAPEAVLLAGTSVTGLYALELHPDLHADQLVATVQLHHTSVVNGKKETITREVRAGDLAKGWQRSSRRHRLASLGAVWGETLKGSAAGFDIARRAEELVTQDPKDARAKELAAAASASADGSR